MRKRRTFPTVEFTKALIKSMFAPWDAGHVCILPDSKYPAAYYAALLPEEGIPIFGENTIQGVTGFLIGDRDIERLKQILLEHGAVFTYYDSQTGRFATSGG